MDDLDVLDRYPQPARDDLRERRLVTLTVTMRAGEHGDSAGRIDAHFAHFVQPRPRAERTRDVRRRDAAGFDVR